MQKLLRTISGRMPVAKDVLPWLQKEVYPLLKDLRDLFNTFVDEYNLAIAGKKNYHGFANRTDSSIGYAPAQDLFQITPGVNRYSFWYKGERVVRSVIEYVGSIPAEQQFFIYFRKVTATDGTYTFQLFGSTTAWDFYEHIPVALLYKFPGGTLVYEERHGYDRNIDWHAWAHDTIGARHVSGMSGSFNNTSMQITAGNMRDEDILYGFTDAQTTASILYRAPGLTTMLAEFGSTTPYKATGGVIQFDSSGTLTNVSSGNYTNSWVYATTAQGYPIHIIVGRGQYASVALADAETSPSIVGFSVVEYAILYRVRYRQVGANITYDGVTDLRRV